MDSPLRIVVVTGMSGAGKSTALRVLEDLGYFCVDNLPTPLVPEFARMAKTRSDIDHVALGIDARGRTFGVGTEGLAVQLQQEGYSVKVLFLDAADGELVRRFSESRRPHPLAAEAGVVAGIVEERQALSGLRDQAALVIDTTLLTVHQLRRRLSDRFGAEQAGDAMVIRLMSFGFRFGLPVDADVLFDVRFLPNPFYIQDLKPLSGLDQPVAQYVLAQEEAQRFLTHCKEMFDFLLPLYRREGKSYLTIGLGCTGGRHRSVALTEALNQHVAAHHRVAVIHRDVERYQVAAGAGREAKS
jgi:UPF0042 nucleotide-binding protein